MILAPLRGVTVRTFRRVFAPLLAECGFDEAVTPFIAANRGLDPLKDPELKAGEPEPPFLRITPQFIGKDPFALRESLMRIKDAGFETADLNCGCPFPMIRKKGRGSGILRSPDVLDRMLEAGCGVMGPGAFSVKARLGVESNGELLALMPVFNRYPLRHIAVHARNAKQMYSGECDWTAYREIESASLAPVVPNGDLPVPQAAGSGRAMAGRGFVRYIAAHPRARELLGEYIEASCEEFSGPAPVLGRMKELLAYWKDLPGWSRAWPVVKMAKTADELRIACGLP